MENIEKKKKFKFPHTYTILFAIIVLVVILTHIIPAGNFDKIADPETGATTIDPNSFKYVEKTPAGFFDIFLSIQKGMVQGSSIIFLIIFAYYSVFTITKTGALHGGINVLLKKLKGKEFLSIPIFMVIFALAGSTYGEWDTIYGLIPIFVGLAIALGYDALVGLAMSGLAVAMGFASATTNPFTIGIAQSIAELPLFSGLGFRVIIFIVFVGTSIWWTMRYAAKIKKNPDLSIMKGINIGKLEINRDEIDNVEFTAKRKITLLIFLASIILIVYTSLELGWFLDEMSALFLLCGIIVSIIWREGPDKIIKNIIDATCEIISAALVIGISRAVVVILTEGNILDTIIYSLSKPLASWPSWMAAEGMLVFQNIMNFFIPSGSGLATTVMPIMTPLADLVEVNRQVAVLAYQFGDGYSNLIWPTGAAVMASIAKVPLEKWYKFFGPLFVILVILQIVFIYIATIMNYGPF